jgi:glycosyltransferase involved in cell wall biosynthesis
VKPVVSVVIPTYRRPEMLERCLRAVIEQDFDAPFEIIVADDEPSDVTLALITRLRAEQAAAPPVRLAASAGMGAAIVAAPSEPMPALRYIAMRDAHGPAAARNAGWRAASGRIVAFTDDDCRPMPGWLRAGVAALHDGIAGVDGRVIVPVPSPPTDAQRTLTGLERSRFVTANCFYRKAALLEAGGFDERFAAPWREDSDLYFTLLERGRRLERVPAAIVVHPVRPPERFVSLREQKKSMYNALLYKKHRALYRARLQSRPPLRYYAALGALLVASGSLAKDRRVAGVAGLAAWTAITLEFAAERLRGTSRRPSHVADMLITSALIPPLSVWWRLRGAWKYRVLFL